MTAKPPNMTTDAGISVAGDEYSLAFGPADSNLLRALGTCLFPIRDQSGCSLIPAFHENSPVPELRRPAPA